MEDTLLEDLQINEINCKSLGKSSQEFNTHEITAELLKSRIQAKLNDKIQKDLLLAIGTNIEHKQQVAWGSQK